MYIHGGRTPTGIDAVEWAGRWRAGRRRDPADQHGPRRRAHRLRPRLTRAVVDAVDVPVIASGGVGRSQDLVDGIKVGGADAVLAASIFHYGEFTIGAGEGGDGRRRHREST